MLRTKFTEAETTTLLTGSSMALASQATGPGSRDYPWQVPKGNYQARYAAEGQYSHTVTLVYSRRTGCMFYPTARSAGELQHSKVVLDLAGVGIWGLDLNPSPVINQENY